MTMKQEKKRIYLRAALALAALLLVLLALDNLSFVPSMLLTVLRKGAIYALVAVSMNLLNGFTGLFSLGQAGFMLLGAYTYAILTIPAASQKSIYQRYANGGIGFSIPELLSKPLGGFGLLLGVVFCLILAGFIAALFAFLIGLPVLKLKSDYLAIATLGFAEIIRAAVVYEGFGPLTNGSNLLYGFTSFASFNLSLGGTTLHLETVMPFLFSGVCIAIILLLINSTYGRAFKAMQMRKRASARSAKTCCMCWALRMCATNWLPACPTACSAVWRSRAPLPPSRSCCCWMSLLPV